MILDLLKKQLSKKLEKTQKTQFWSSRYFRLPEKFKNSHLLSWAPSEIQITPPRVIAYKFLAKAHIQVKSYDFRKLMHQYIITLVIYKKHVQISNLVNFITGTMDAVVDNLESMQPVLTEARSPAATMEESFQQVAEKIKISEIK